MAKKKKHINTDLPIIMDYGAGNISVYDPTGMMPYSEPPITEQTRFKKLGKEMKAEFKWLVSPVVIEYWQENLLNLFRFSSFLAWFSRQLHRISLYGRNRQDLCPLCAGRTAAV